MITPVSSLSAQATARQPTHQTSGGGGCGHFAPWATTSLGWRGGATMPSAQVLGLVDSDLSLQEPLGLALQREATATHGSLASE